MKDKKEIENLHKGNYSHPGGDYELITNIPTEAEYALKVGEVRTVGEAFNDEGVLIEGHDSLWRRKVHA